MKMISRMLAVWTVALLAASTAHGALRSDGAVLNDDFDGSSLAAQWTEGGGWAGGGTLTVGGGFMSLVTEMEPTHLVDLTDDLSYGAVTDPAYEIRFKVQDGDLGGSSREYSLLVGRSNAKFNLSLLNEGGYDGEVTSKFQLNWNGIAEGTGGAQALVTLDRDTFYTVMAAYDSVSSQYDIYLDGALIDTKAELNAGLAPRLRMGDTTSDAEADAFIVDFVRVGNLVPEPATLTLLGLGACACFFRRRK